MTISLPPDNGEQGFSVPVDKGYYVNLPSRSDPDVHSGETAKATAVLSYVSANTNETLSKRLYVHEIEMSFEIGGSTAQSIGYRTWYPRNMVRPTIQITGQCVNQADYGTLAQFIKQGQTNALRWKSKKSDMNQMKLAISAGGIGNHKRAPQQVLGHVVNIQRITERFKNAPEYTFQFIVANGNATTGLFQTEGPTFSGLDQKGNQEVVEWMQITNLVRTSNDTGRGSTSTIVVAPDPDNALLSAVNGRTGNTSTGSGGNPNSGNPGG